MSLSIPNDWPDAVAVIASRFHFTRSDIWSMPVRELEFWLRRVESLAEAEESSPWR